MTTQETIQTVTTSQFIEAIHGSNAEIYFNVDRKTWKNKPQTYAEAESKLKWLIPYPPPGLVNTTSIRTSTLRNWLKTQSSTRTSRLTTPMHAMSMYALKKGIQQLIIRNQSRNSLLLDHEKPRSMEIIDLQYHNMLAIIT